MNNISRLRKVLSKIKKWKKNKKEIVLTNGCFDLLHAGHKYLFRQAKKKNQKLIVLINSDKSVKNLKGNKRPIENQIIRTKNLLDLKYVDDVYIFEESTPLKMIKSICPDVLVKGADYNIHEIVGAKFVLANGGKVRTIPLTPGFSTTKLIEKMVQWRPCVLKIFVLRLYAEFH